MKRHIPYFSFYPADFMNGVRGLTPQEVGIYMMLLCRIYEESGPVEYSLAKLSTYCNCTTKAFEKTALRLIELGKIIHVDGCLSNPRAEAEISKRENALASSKRGGKKSAEKRQEKQQAAPSALQGYFNHSDTDTEKKSSVSKDTGAGAPIDPEKVMFDGGIRLLTAAGKSTDQARSIIGKWKRDFSTPEVIAALGKAQREGAIDPVGFITKTLGETRRRDRAPEPRQGDERTLPDGRQQILISTGWITKA